MHPKNSLTYRDAGVDIDAGNELVRRIKPHVRSTRRPGADGERGAFFQRGAWKKLCRRRCNPRGSGFYSC